MEDLSALPLVEGQRRWERENVLPPGYRGLIRTKIGDSRAGATLLNQFLFCIIGAVLLTACAAQPNKADVATRTTKSPTPTLQAPVGIAPEPPPATIWQSADKLIGLGAEELQVALGKPARIRDEADSRIYQYVGRDCVLDLFLYSETAGGYHVSYAEARSARAEKKSVDACLKSLPAPVVADNRPTS